MAKTGTPQTPADELKDKGRAQVAQTPNKPPETPSAATSDPLQKPVDQVISEAEAIAAGDFKPVFQGMNLGAPTFDDGQTADPTPKEMIAGTPANPKTMALPTDEVAAFALIRSNDGMWRAVQYKIKGATVLQVRTKEPDLKALLAAQITDCLALDMPLFNDEEAPRE